MPESSDRHPESSSDAPGEEVVRSGSAPGAEDDLAEFATFRRSAGSMPVVAALVVAAVFSLAVLAWVFLR